MCKALGPAILPGKQGRVLLTNEQQHHHTSANELVCQMSSQLLNPAAVIMNTSRVQDQPSASKPALASQPSALLYHLHAPLDGASWQVPMAAAAISAYPDLTQNMCDSLMQMHQTHIHTAAPSTSIAAAWPGGYKVRLPSRGNWQMIRLPDENPAAGVSPNSMHSTLGKALLHMPQA